MTEIVKRIRPISLALIKRKSDGAFLVDRGYDSKKGEYFYRALGGGIEWQESSTDALIREFKEEIDREIKVGKQLVVAENIFTFEGREGHEICFIYEVEFVNDNDYLQDKFYNTEGHDNCSIWKTIEEIKAEGAKLYPNNFADIVGM